MLLTIYGSYDVFPTFSQVEAILTIFKTLEMKGSQVAAGN